MFLNVIKGLIVGFLVLGAIYFTFKILLNVLEALAGLSVEQATLLMSSPGIAFIAYLVGNAVLEIRKEKQFRYK